MRKLFALVLLVPSLVFGQGGRPPVDHYSQLLDVNVTGLQLNNVMVWNGSFWVPGTGGGGGPGLPSISGQGGKFLTNDGTTIFWDFTSFASLTGKPTSANGYGINNGATIDLWGAKTPYAGNLVIASGKTGTFNNTVSFSGTDGASLNIGSGGTLGSNAFNSTAFALQSTTVNGQPLSSNVTITKSDVGLGYLFSGSGSPEGAITAPIGSQYARTDGGVGTSFYVKQSGTGNTGWAAGAGGGSLPTGGTVGQVLVKNSSTNYDASWAADPGGVGGGSGTVTSVSVVTANGISGTVATATTTPAITLALGNITPSGIAATGTITGTNLSGTNTGDQTITLTGPVTGSGTGSFATSITDGSVGLPKIAGIPSNTILGNNTAGITSPVALTALQTKTLLSLNNVENTAISTWPGSGNIVTVGNLTSGTVAYSMLPVGSLASTVAAGNDSRFGTSVTGIRKGAGAPANDTAGVPNVDFDKMVRTTIADIDGAWPTPTPIPTMMEQSAELTTNRTTTLPAASAFPSGTIIRFSDGLTGVTPTNKYGRGFKPAGTTDTLDGLTSSAISGVGLIYFTKGGVDASGNKTTSSVQFETDGIGAWKHVTSGIVKGLRDMASGFSATFDTGSMPDGTSIRIIGSGPIPQPTVAPTGQAFTGMDSGGTFAYNIWGVPDPTGNDGKVAQASGGGVSWVTPGAASGDQPFTSSSISIAGSTATWTADNSYAGKQNALLALNADYTLSMSGFGNGKEYRLVITQGSGGSHKLLLPAGSYVTPNGQAGVLNLSTAAGSIDVVEGFFDGTRYHFIPVALNQTAATVVTGPCGTKGDDGNLATPSTNEKFGDVAGHTYIASSFVASSSYTACRVDLPLKKVIASGSSGPNFNIDAYIYTDSSGHPGTMVGPNGSTNVFNASSLTTSITTNSFTGLSAPLTVGTTYWVVVRAESISVNSGDFVHWQAAPLTGLNVKQSLDTSSWGNLATNVQCVFSVWHN